MMKIIYTFLICILSINAKITEPVKIKYTIVYYLGFDNFYYSDFNEKNFYNIQCKYLIDIKRFKNIVRINQNYSKNYINLIRAKIIISKKEYYFIDRNGIVKHSSGKFGIINKEIFESLLIKNAKNSSLFCYCSTSEN